MGGDQQARDASSAAGFVSQTNSLRVLLVNFTLDDGSPVLAHQAAFARKLVDHAKAVHVVTELLGEFVPPPGMSITAIPRWPYGIPRRLGSIGLCVPRARARIREFQPDVCFVHMAHEWCYRLGPFLRLHNVPILLWYTHKQVSDTLKKSTSFADRIVTATPEGFRLPSSNVQAIGHGIDVNRFSLANDAPPRRGIISVGRISAVKRLDLLLSAFALLCRSHPRHDLELSFVGAALTAEDQAYKRHLERMAAANGVGSRLLFTGPVRQRDLPSIYRAASLHVNVTDAGGLDKSILEALACGCPVLTTNKAYFDTLAAFPGMRIEDQTAEAIAERMHSLLADQDLSSGPSLRQLIVGRHDLDTHVKRIVTILSGLHEGKKANWA